MTTRLEVQKTALGLYNSIKDLTPAQKKQFPGCSYAEFYNSILKEAKLAKPDLNPNLWPPQVLCNTVKLGPSHSLSTYADISGFLSAIISQMI